MDVSINVLAVLLAAVSTMVVGSVWYSPKTFYPLRQRLSNAKTNADFKGAKAAQVYSGVFVASLVTALVLAYLAELRDLAVGGNYLVGTLFVGVAAWLAFTAARMFTHDVFEGRPRLLTVLNA